MKQKQLFSSICAAVILFAACKKDNNSTTATPTPTPSKTPKELIVGTWAIQSVTTNDPGNPDPMPSCAKDDILTIKADGTCTADAGATKCDPSDPQSQNGTWKLDSYPAFELKTPSDTLQSTIKITQLDETTLKWERVFTQVSPTIFIYTWKRK
ncbi:MAG: lipocalin family protein [Bacteroidetes bacterium]|nr:lipocalin family protein [Bacteroidota bacterium]